MEKKEHIISILVYNKPDVLARIAGTLGGKGYNIESLSVNATNNYEISKIVMTTIGNQATITRIENQLRRFVDVIQVDNLTNVESIHREMMLVRLNITADNKDSIKKAIDTYKWKVLVSAETYIVLEITGDKQQIDFVLARLEPLGIADLTRTGIVALELES
jgi:acetolactate synthase I/III small subunit